MAAPTPEDADLIARVAGFFLTIGATIWGGMKYIDSRFDKKADKDAVKASFDDINEELGTQRSHIAKIFDTITANERRAQDRHERLMERLSK